MATHPGPHVWHGRPMSWIRKVERVAVGRGHMQQLTLSCGHTVLRMLGRDFQLGMRTLCPECK